MLSNGKNIRGNSVVMVMGIVLVVYQIVISIFIVVVCYVFGDKLFGGGLKKIVSVRVGFKISLMI